MIERHPRARGYVRWPNGTAEPVEVIDGAVFIDGFGPFTFSEILTEYRGWLCIER